MKKAILTLAAIASLGAAANAQKGNILVFGDVSFHSLKDEGGDQYLSYHISPGVGYYVTDHIAVGLAGSYGLDSAVELNGSSKYAKLRSYRAGAFARYTQNLGHTFYAYGQFDAAYQGTSEKYGDDLVPGSKTNGLYLNLTPAIGVNITRCIGINFSFGGATFTTLAHENSSTTATKFDFGFGTQANIGASFVFGGHHMMHRKGHHEMMDDTRQMDSSDDSDMDNGKKKKKMRKDDDE